MKTFLISIAAAIVILAAPAAFAQNGDQPANNAARGNETGEHGNQPGGHHEHNATAPSGTNEAAPNGHTGEHGNAPPGGTGQSNNARGNEVGTQGMGEHGNATRGNQTGMQSGMGHENNAATRGNESNGMQGGTGHENNFNNNERSRGNQNGQMGNSHGHANIDLRRFQRNVKAQHRFRIGAYHAPRGYHYRRWTFGERLPRIYFVQDYWITDFAAYDLMEPPEGYVWVRYGPDALLIDEDTGEIVEVVYGVFY